MADSTPEAYWGRSNPHCMKESMILTLGNRDNYGGSKL